MDEHKKFPGIGIEISLQNPCRMCRHDHCGNCAERKQFTRTWEQSAIESINNLQNELKPCPFCGEIPRVSCSGISMKFYIWCETDNCILRCLADDNATEYSDMFDLIHAWNRRSDNVRHGRWIELPKSCQADYECSKCGAGIGKVKPPYCAYCGALMEKGD